MNLLTKISILACMGLFTISCCDNQKKISIIDDNIAVAEQQIGLLLAKTMETGELRIPSTYSDGENIYVPLEDWVSGFFSGTLWYMYELTGDEKWAVAAQAHTENIDSVKHLKWHHDVGFMIYNSFGNGLRLKGIKGYDEVLLTAAQSLATRFRDNADIIQSWDSDKGWQSERGWDCPVIIDNMMNLELFFKITEMTGDSTFHKMALRHADRTMKEHFRDDYSCVHVVDYSTKTGEVRGRCTAQGFSDESAWARGQAWAIYGYVVCYRATGDKKYLDFAENISNFILNDKNMPEDLVPYWDYDASEIPNVPRDASSASIISSALYELYTYTEKQEYLDAANKMVESLSSPAYRAAVGENGGFILMHSVGSLPHGSQIDVPLSYADYYFLEALIRKRNLEQGKPGVVDFVRK